jgi:hypothetical protein
MLLILLSRGMLHNCYEVIVMKCLSIRPIFVVPLNWQRFFVMMQILKCLSMPSIHHWKGNSDVNWKDYLDFNWKGYNDIVDYVFTELQIKFLPGSGSYKSTWRGRHVLLQCIFTLQSCTIDSLTQHRWSNASLFDTHMERASIPPLSSTSKAFHLFRAEHVWKEMLGVSLH